MMECGWDIHSELLTRMDSAKAFLTVQMTKMVRKIMMEHLTLTGRSITRVGRKGGLMEQNSNSVAKTVRSGARKLEVLYVHPLLEASTWVLIQAWEDRRHPHQNCNCFCFFAARKLQYQNQVSRLIHLCRMKTNIYHCIGELLARMRNL